VHFRFGKDPNNLLRGFSPLAAVMREVYTDDQAANFTAAILKNLGIIGVIFSPKDGTIPKEQAKKLKDYVQRISRGTSARRP
jgi:phage portal protein BeeE